MAVEMGTALRAPFAAKDICWRVGSTTQDKKKGLALAYIDARAVQRRLDDLFGWDGWRTEYHSLNGTGVICALSVRVGNERWVTKQDGADPTDIEATKGGISDAFKRVAASGFGIGRYLYGLPSVWAELKPVGRSYAIKTPPQLPAWALPEGEPAPRTTPDPDKAIDPRTDAATPAERGEEGTSTDKMVKSLSDAAWLNDDQFGMACTHVGQTLSVDKWTPDEVAKGYAYALTIRTTTGKPGHAPPPDTSEPVTVPVCPKCGGEVEDKRRWNGKVAFKCVKSSWDKEAKKELGCDGVIWQTEVDKHPERYPA